MIDTTGDPTLDIPLGEGMEFIEACPCCHGTDIPIAIVTYLGDVPQNFCSVCEDCGQNFLNPRMSEAQTAIYYQGEYRDTVGNDISGDDSIRQFARASYQKIIVKASVRAGNSALEIGSSMGCMLNVLSELGFTDCVGVEPDERYHVVRPANRFTNYTDISKVPQQAFDLIVMSHSLEHINQPLDYMSHLLTHYAHKGTQIFIEVPDTDVSQLYRIEHPINFTLDTLNGLFARLGCNLITNVQHGMGYMSKKYYLVGVYEYNPIA
jgi:hypothetical protein